MLSDEEREALEILKGFEPDDLVECAIYLQALEKVKNLIEKQLKEIEELKKYEEGYKLLSYSLDDYTSNDKIKAKIEEWQKEKEFYNKDEDREWGQYNNWDWIDTIINEMQSLLKRSKYRYDRNRNNEFKRIFRKQDKICR